MDHAKTGGLGSSNLRPIEFLTFLQSKNMIRWQMFGFRFQQSKSNQSSKQCAFRKLTSIIGKYTRCFTIAFFEWWSQFKRSLKSVNKNENFPQRNDFLYALISLNSTARFVKNSLTRNADHISQEIVESVHSFMEWLALTNW